jgi:hypothetical protein
MNSRRNETVERDLSIQVLIGDLEKETTDQRNGLRLGTVIQLCDQFGISVSKGRNKAVLTAKRDNMQMLVEKLHYCYIKYSILA